MSTECGSPLRRRLSIDHETRLTSTIPRDEQIGRVLGEFLEQQKLGLAPTKEDLLQQHPELASELSACLASLDFVNLAGGFSRPARDAPNVSSPPRELGDFRIVRELGRGGMGIVYVADQISLNRQVALKVLPLAGVLDERNVQRFKNEARAAALLHHSNIVPVYNVGCEQGIHFYTMQLIDGQTLAELIKTCRGHKGGYSVAKLSGDTKDTAVTVDTKADAGQSTDRKSRDATFNDAYHAIARVGIQAADALQHAHEIGVIHRDIKPSNILVDSRFAIWIADFGLAHCKSDSRLTMTGDLLGTLRYMSPEQSLGKQGILDHRTDIYSLGATLYELTSGTPAFVADDRQQLLHDVNFRQPPSLQMNNSRVPWELETIILKAMAKHPAERYSNAEDLANDLRRFVAYQPIRAKRPNAWQRLKRLIQRHQGIAATIVISTIVLLSCLAAILTVNGHRLTSAYNLAEQQRKEADAGRLLAQTAQFESLRQTARAYTSAQQRFLALDAISQAADMMQDLETTSGQKKSLREDAITSFSLPADLQIRKATHSSPTWWTSYNADLTRYAKDAVNNKVIGMYDAANDREISRLPEGFHGATKLSPDGAIIATASPHLVVWSLTDLQHPKKLLTLGECGGADYFETMAFSESGELFVAVLAGNFLETYRMPDAQQVHRFKVPFTVADLTFHPNGRDLSLVNGTKIEVWNPTEGDIVDSLEIGVDIKAHEWHPNQRFVAVAGLGNNNDCYVFDAVTKEKVSTLSGHAAIPQKIAFSPNGDLVVTNSWDGTSRLWRWRTADEVARMSGRFVQFDRTGDRLGFCNDHEVGIWDVSMSGEFKAITRIEGRSHNYTAELNLAGTQLAYCDNVGVRIWDTEFGELVCDARLGKTTSAWWLDDDKRLITYGVGGLRQWDVATLPSKKLELNNPALLMTESGNHDYLATARLSANERWLAAVGSESVAIFDLQRPHERFELKGHEDAISVDISSDGKMAVTSSRTKLGLILWDVAKQEKVLDLWPESQRTRIGFSPDNSLLVAASPSDYRIWSCSSWKQIATLPIDDALPETNPFAFSRDSSTLAVLPAYSNVRLYDMTTPASPREIVTIATSDDLGQSVWLDFSCDSSSLAIGSGKIVQVLNVKLIRERLRKLNLDWIPAYPDYGR